MSVLTTTALLAAYPATLTVGLGPAWGAWVTAIATTSAPIAIAGVQVYGGTYTLRHYDLDLGVGAAGAEVSVGTLRVAGEASSSTVTGPTGLVLPVPLGGIGAGVRVAVRARATPTAQGPTGIILLYYQTFDSDQVTTASQVLTGAPTATTAVTLTPSATPWANSAWGELIASAATDIGLLGLAHFQAGGSGVTSDGYEYDLGTGAAGAETVITTLREAAYVQRVPHTWLPGIYPVAAGTRVAVRIRKAGTSTLAHDVSLLYYTNVSAAAAAVETAQPFVWMPV